MRADQLQPALQPELVPPGHPAALQPALEGPLELACPFDALDLEVVASPAELARELVPLLPRAAPRPPSARPRLRYALGRRGERFELARDGRTVLADDPLDLAPTLLGDLLDQAVRARPGWVALHGAALRCSGEERALLAVGPSSAGKSSLALGLVGAGFQLYGDDVALVGPGGLVSGLPFAPSFEEEEDAPAELLAALPADAELAWARHRRRGDGEIVRRRAVRLAPRALAARPAPLGLLLVLEARAARDVRPLTPAEAVALAWGERSYSLEDEDPVALVGVLTQALRGARAYRVASPTAAAALEQVRRLATAAAAAP